MRKKAGSKPGLIDLWVLIPVLALVLIGVWLVFDASYAKAADYTWTNKDPWYFAKKQIISAVIGLVAMAVMSKVKISTLTALTKTLVVMSIVLLIAVMVPHVGYQANGAYRWFRLPHGITLQPSEIAKIAVVLYLAQFLSQSRRVVQRIDSQWLAPTIVIGLIAGLIFKEPDMGTAIAIVFTCFAMLFAAGVRKRFMFSVVGVGAFEGWLAIKLEPYRMDRVHVWLDPWKHRYGDGYQIVHSLIALGTGGLYGLGPCEGREKLYIPAASTDFIFSTVGEEIGLIGCLAVLGLFMIFIYKGLDVARRSKTPYLNLLAVGITSMIGLQVLINVAVVSASIPATGVPLPFMSYGGSSLILTLAGVGILLSISRRVGNINS